LRTKEEAHDYRYFPDPDLLPLGLDEAFIEEIRARLPELPDAKQARFVEQYGLSAYDAGVLVAERASADYFELAATGGRDPKLVANWVITELFGALNRTGREIAMSPVTPERLGRLVELIEDGTISGRLAKDVFADMFESGDDPAAIVEKRGLQQISDAGALERIIFEIIDANPDQVESYRKNPKALGWFVGQVMKATKGQANPQLVNEVLKKKLGS
jgi:aspartyl-tRNA(Asn)/glutamyl-tRNA(Gln) amidotransferase subunit B